MQVGKRAPQVDLESFYGNPPKYTYFMSMFKESVEKKIEDPKGRLTQLIRHTRGEAKDLIKNFINDRPEYGYNNAMTILHRQYGNPHTLLSSYKREVRQMGMQQPSGNYLTSQSNVKLLKLMVSIIL